MISLRHFPQSDTDNVLIIMSDTERRAEERLIRDATQLMADKASHNKKLSLGEARLQLSVLAHSMVKSSP